MLTTNEGYTHLTRSPSHLSAIHDLLSFLLKSFIGIVSWFGSTLPSFAYWLPRNYPSSVFVKIRSTLLSPFPFTPSPFPLFYLPCLLSSFVRPYHSSWDRYGVYQGCRPSTAPKNTCLCEVESSIATRGWVFCTIISLMGRRCKREVDVEMVIVIDR